jgi:hypothetical protein
MHAPSSLAPRSCPCRLPLPPDPACLLCPWPAGQLEDRTKPILFSMARLDQVKNLTGLAEWYAGNSRLRSLVNLVIVGE